MPRLVNHQGVVVSVSAETAARLGGDWQPVEEPKQAEAQPKPAPKRQARK